MNIETIIHRCQPIQLHENDGKIPWSEPEFSRRMLDNHLSQEHNWASRKLPVIKQQVNWIIKHLKSGARILDLGCGPGLYTHQLAKHGFHCTGVDFSPAAIEYAKRRASEEELPIQYALCDMRHYQDSQRYDFIMLTFGELNVFSAQDVAVILAKCRQWLTTHGQLLLEVHTFDEVKRQGETPATWQALPTGLFLPKPHVLLTENQWDAIQHVATTIWWAIEESGQVTRFVSQMSAWHEKEYEALFVQAGFSTLKRIPHAEWPVSETFFNKLIPMLIQ